MTSAALSRPDPFSTDEEGAAAGFALPGPDSDYEVVEVKAVDDFTLYVTHRDGVHGYVRFDPLAFSGIFQSLSNPAIFRQAYVNHGALGWSDEIDISPDNMHRHLFAFGEWIIK